MSIHRTRADELRAEFDGAFQRAVDMTTPDVEDLIAIRVGGDPHAIRIAAVAGLFVDRRITRVPGRHPALLGLTGIRGTLVPVFDLATALGYARPSSSRWLVIAARAPLALAFEAYEGHTRVPRGAALTRPLVDLEFVIASIEQKER